MGDWQSRLTAYPLDWLLEEENPSVRYLALTDLQGAPPDAPQALVAREAVMQRGLVPALLEKMAAPDYIENYSRFYTDKYRGLVWSLIVLAEHRATADAQILGMCEYLMQNAQEAIDGGFAQHTAARAGGGRISEVIPCLTGNLTWCFLTLGLAQDARVQRGLSWLARNLRVNDGQLLLPPAEPYGKLEACYGAHSCHMGVVKTLKAFAAAPEPLRTPALLAAQAQGAEYLLMHHVDRRSHNLARYAKPGWRSYGFPLMYQSDTLEALDILTALGYRDPRMAEAVETVLAKQGADGRWAQANAYAAERLLLPMEAEGAPSKWITLRALRVLKRYFG